MPRDQVSLTLAWSAGWPVAASRPGSARDNDTRIMMEREGIVIFKVHLRFVGNRCLDTESTAIAKGLSCAPSTRASPG